MSPDQDHTTFENTWRSPAGWPAALAAVNNQPIGIRFMVTSWIFFFICGAMALLMRLQLAVPDNTLIGPQLFNELFTMHGSTMMYLFVIPFLEGLALYLIPPMIGARDVAFPRLTALSYWVYLFGGLIFYFSFLVGAAPDAGWFAYTPLSGPEYAGVELDFWLLGLAMVEIAGIATGIEIVVTILKFRAPGMTLARMPIFVWTMLVAGIMIIFAFTVLLVATALLELDRAAGTRFFDPGGGGSSLLWQHLFWFFGHPDVYIMFLPATGIISMVIPVFARRRLAVYTLVVVAIVLTGFLSFGLWVHHMYTTGLPILAMNFFAAASLMIAVASGIQVFAWIATMWSGSVRFSAAMLNALGFLFVFTIGGLTGVMIAVVPFDWQVHDTYFIVAHFHYVLVGGVVFPILAGMHYWIPKITGRLLSEKLGHWSFWLIFAGFNITFFPMHIMGLLGMPRRVYTYPAVLQVEVYNLIATAGSFVLGLGFLLFAWNVHRSRRRGQPAGDDPFKSPTLEWSLPSPLPPYSFRKPPAVHSRHPQWDEPTAEEPEPSARARAALDAKPSDWRATLVTDAVTAEPRAIQRLPGPTYLPLWTALALVLSAAGVLLKLHLVALFSIALCLVFVVRWVWPPRTQAARLRADSVAGDSGLPVLASGTHTVAWWGMVSLLTCLGSAAAALIYSYFFSRMLSDQWPQGDLPLPRLVLPAAALAALFAGSAAQVIAHRAQRSGRWAPTRAALAAASLCGLIFLALQGWALTTAGFGPRENAYASFFHVLNWMVALYAATAIALNIGAIIGLTREKPDEPGYSPLQVQLARMFAHFTTAVAAAVFATVFLSPHLL
jgi:cytochrome c oxidase subunit I+III